LESKRLRSEVKSTKWTLAVDETAGFAELEKKKGELRLL
jgi:hypothetical protein